MLDHKYAELSTKISIFRSKDKPKDFKGITFLGYIQMYTSVHSDVSQESYSFELFDLPLNVPFVREITQGYMAYVFLWSMDSFDLRCESVTYGICRGKLNFLAMVICRC